MQIKAYGRSVIGGRDANQDAFLLCPDKHLYAVADGVGGGMKGDVASAMAVELFESLAPAEGSLRKTLEAMQEKVLQAAMDEFGEAVMGTTFTGVRLQGNLVSIIHTGDSRAYLFTGGLLRQITEDHECFDERYQGTVLASYLGVPTDTHPLKIQEETFALEEGNAILLCSDGLYRQLVESDLAAWLREEATQTDPESVLKKMCDEAAKAEYSDNVTVVLIQRGFDTTGV